MNKIKTYLIIGVVIIVVGLLMLVKKILPIKK